MKYLLIGGAGLIGAKVASKLQKLGHQVLIYDSLVNYLSPFDKDGGLTKLMKHPWSIGDLLNKRFIGEIEPRISFIRGDVRYKGHLIKAISKFSPDVIINFAAIPLSSESNEFTEDATTVNVNGVQNILESIRDVGTSIKFIHASSSMAYGDFAYQPCDENHPTDPIDIYGATKLAGEKIIQAYGHQFGIDWTIIRPSAVYGPTDANWRVIQLLVDKAIKGEPLTIHNPESALDFTHVEDISDGFVLAATLHEQSRNQVFNITRGESRTLDDLCNLLKLYFPNLKIELSDRSKAEVRSERGALCIDKAKKILGYKPRYSLEDGLADYLNTEYDIRKKL